MSAESVTPRPPGERFWRLPLATTTWDDEEITALRAVIDSGRYTLGPRVLAFEREFAQAVGSRHAIMVNSGSSANLIAVAALVHDDRVDLSPGDEVLVTAVSWATSYYPLAQLGLVPVLVDINPDTLNIDVAAAERACTSRTKGILAVNLLGNPCDFAALRGLCEARGLVLLEDNCESLGASFEGRSAGTFGRVGTYSSYFSHHISTMEGGMVVTDDDLTAQILHSLRSHGWTRGLPSDSPLRPQGIDTFDDLFCFVLPGYNVRPLEMSGAVGSRQLVKLPTLVEGRRRNASVFTSLFEGHPGVRTQRETHVSSWFGFSLVLVDRMAGRRDEVVEALTREGIETRPVVAGNFSRNPVVSRLAARIAGPLTSADEVHDQGFYVGNHHYDITDELQVLHDIVSSFL